jgi:gluconate 2-dehydrogenase gamma chain
VTETGQGKPKAAWTPTALTPSQFATVEALAGRIIPTTDSPGAIEGGSACYIDQALAGPYADHLHVYQTGITELDRHCAGLFGKPFSELEEERQDEVLEMLEDGKIEGVSEASKLFALLLRHVMEGFFCEPKYGGNRDLVGWKLVGFPGQRYGYDDPYINRTVDLPPIAFDGPPRKID